MAGSGAGVVLLAALVGCGSRSGLSDALVEGDAAAYPWEAAAAAGRGRAPRSCAEDWRILYESEASISTSLAVTAGEVIFGVGLGTAEPAQVRAIDIASARQRVIRNGSSDELWLEGHELLVWDGDRVIRTPLSGAGEEVLLDVRSPGASGRLDVLVQRDAFYWARARMDSARIDVWRQPRQSGPARLVGSVDGATVPELLAATRELVLVAATPSAMTLSLLDGALRQLDEVPAGVLAGADALGAYYTRTANRTRRGGRADEFEIQRTPVDGSTSTRVWRGSAGQRLTRLWPAESGWFATGAYYMFNGTPHAVIAHIDVDGEVSLIACDRANNNLASRPEFWQGGFYAVTTADGLWRIVEIRL